MIEIITDSTCDIPADLLEKHEIKIVPAYILWGAEQYRDRIDIQPEEFYKRLTTDPQRPTSSMGSVADFRRAYEAAAARGADEIVTITVSSAMSGTYQSALEASKLVQTPVTVVDSKGPTMTLGWQVLAAARARDAGADIQKVLETIERVRSKLVLLVSMDSLEYLQKGGRIGDAIKWVGGLLKVKPLVRINHDTGRVEPVSLARTHRAAVDALYDGFVKAVEGCRKLHVSVLHGNVPEEAKALVERIHADLKPIELLVNITGPVLGNNTGPGALALSGYAEE